MPNPKGNPEMIKAKLGGRKGRKMPRPQSFHETLKEILNHPKRFNKIMGKYADERHLYNANGWDLVAIRLYEKAVLDGDLKAIDMIMDRIEGKATQRIEQDTTLQLDITRKVQRKRIGPPKKKVIEGEEV